MFASSTCTAARAWSHKESARAARASTTSATRSSTCTRSACAIRISSASSTPRWLCAKMARMTPALWPARLHHLRRDSPNPERLARFYGELLGDRVEPLPDASFLVAGRGRRLIVGQGAPATVPYFALEVHERAQLAGCKSEPFSSPLFEDGAVALTDPDGRRVVLGVSKQSSDEAGLPGRLQHFVCATTRLGEMLEFYRALGMVESDRVLEAEALSAVFLRSDPEHHSFAAFRAPESRADHHCYETNGWLDIRDWADRMAKLRVPLFWGQIGRAHV